MGRSISEIDKDIISLFKERNEEILNLGKGFPEVYTVYNSETESIDDNTYVMNPSKKRDLEYLQSYTEGMEEGLFKSLMNDWLKEYSSFKCIRDRVCSISGSPVCCAHCLYLNDCLQEGKEVCPAVDSGDVLVVSDCIVED